MLRIPLLDFIYISIFFFFGLKANEKMTLNNVISTTYEITIDHAIYFYVSKIRAKIYTHTRAQTLKRVMAIEAPRLDYLLQFFHIRRNLLLNLLANVIR